MPTTLTWTAVAVRLLLSFIAGGLIGLNRTEHGRPAGLRTTILVCLAACISMIQANLLMNSTGKAADSFVVLDLMRLPLGILTGVGFIGAGAILRKDDVVFGITTAATMWFVTVLGLCFGGGQLLLGVIGMVLGLIVLAGLKWLEQRVRADRRATIAITLAADALSEGNLRGELAAYGFHIRHWKSIRTSAGSSKRLEFEVDWRSLPRDNLPPPFLQDFSARSGILEVEWHETFRD